MGCKSKRKQRYSLQTEWMLSHAGMARESTALLCCVWTSVATPSCHKCIGLSTFSAYQYALDMEIGYEKKWQERCLTLNDDLNHTTCKVAIELAESKHVVACLH
jgi:hypothetical protein